MPRRLALLLMLLGPVACATAPIDNRPLSRAPTEMNVDDHPLSDTAVVLAFDPDVDPATSDLRETAIGLVDGDSVSGYRDGGRWVRVRPGPHRLNVHYEVKERGMKKFTSLLPVSLYAQPRHVYVLQYLEESTPRGNQVRCYADDLGESPDSAMVIGPDGARIPVRFTADEQPK